MSAAYPDFISCLRDTALHEFPNGTHTRHPEHNVEVTRSVRQLPRQFRHCLLRNKLYTPKNLRLIL